MTTRVPPICLRQISILPSRYAIFENIVLSPLPVKVFCVPERGKGLFRLGPPHQYNMYPILISGGLYHRQIFRQYLVTQLDIRLSHILDEITYCAKTAVCHGPCLPLLPGFALPGMIVRTRYYCHEEGNSHEIEKGSEHAANWNKMEFTKVLRKIQIAKGRPPFMDDPLWP